MKYLVRIRPIIWLTLFSITVFFTVVVIGTYYGGVK